MLGIRFWVLGVRIRRNLNTQHPIPNTMLTVFVAALALRQAPADLIITNARIWTDGHILQADSIAVTGGKFVYIGKSSPDLVGPNTEIRNAQRHLVIPGLIDSHSHLADHGDTLLQLQLRSASSKDDFIQRVKAYAANVKPGGWIIGR